MVHDTKGNCTWELAPEVNSFLADGIRNLSAHPR
jgi:hypothetical protein